MNAQQPAVDWRGPLELADAGRQPRRPSLIQCAAPGFTTYPSLADLAAAVARLLDGRPPVLVRSVATYPEFDTFPAFSVHARGPAGANGGPPAATYVCAVAVQDTPADAFEAAIADAQRTLSAPVRRRVEGEALTAGQPG